MEIETVPAMRVVSETSAAAKAPELPVASTQTSARFELPASGAVAASKSAPAETAAAQSPAKAFEALMIAQMVDIMLPENDAVFGEGAGASVWRSMFVDVLSTQLADDIDLGVARQIEGALSASTPEKGSL